MENGLVPHVLYLEWLKLLTSAKCQGQIQNTENRLVPPYATLLVLLTRASLLALAKSIYYVYPGIKLA